MACYLWVVLLSPQVADVLVMGLVRKGWTVGALAADHAISRECAVSSLVALQVSGVETKNSEKSIPVIVVDEAREILKEFHYLSIIASEATSHCCWIKGNIKTADASDPRKTALEKVAEGLDIGSEDE